jgi:hypothetical protein
MRWIRQFWIYSIYRMKYVYFDGESMEPLKIKIKHAATFVQAQRYPCMSPTVGRNPSHQTVP